ncbi:MAG: zinc-ribbon domain-containing protein [Clostridiales bacterium]|nr:zinc-ribbon domain-containing protein [Clostridiales bacterium]
MFCPHCGNEIGDTAYFCPYCGETIGFDSYYPMRKRKTNVIAIVGFILSFFIAIAGLICSIIGMKKSEELDGKGMGFAIAGVFISVIWMGIVFFVIIL